MDGPWCSGPGPADVPASKPAPAGSTPASRSPAARPSSHAVPTGAKFATDLAEGAGTVVVVEPLAHLSDGAGADVRIVPDERALEGFGDNVGDMSRWTPVYREGRRQAPAAARLLAAALPADAPPSATTA
ncbi:hypothetical protein [Actinomadura chokoriensis]|uniref:hypothetical protein n=1 Tax=Actinomadura chokoriensis TaxID=454156 RepID=UPI0031F9FEC9